jgi:hypothetical protein
MNTPRDELSFIRRIYQQTVARAFSALFFCVCLAVVLALLQAARAGTFSVRILVASGIVFAVVASLLAPYALRKRTASDLGLLNAIVRPAAKFEHAAVARALSLSGLNGVSEELSELHIQRSFLALPTERIVRASKVRERILRALMLFAAGVAAFVFLRDPWGLLEGVDILAAREGVAPVSLAYLAEAEANFRYPEYLKMPERHARVYSANVYDVPQGTLLTLRGVSVHDGRALYLFDGSVLVPFVDDGSEHVAARYPVEKTVTLQVIAKFGDTRIQDPQTLQINCIPDAAPMVTLEGAPKQIVLSEGLPGGELPLRYEASDDHGLREVHLVLRAAGKEERRVLSKLDGETKQDRGGYALRTNDTFIKKSYAPISVKVEAKDNDAVSGPKWGASEEITLVPPGIGEPEALRLSALRGLRDALVDTLAARMSLGVSEPKLRAAALTELRTLAQSDEQALEALLSKAYAGIWFPAKLEALLRTQAAKVRKAEQSVRSAQQFTPKVLEALVDAQGQYTLVVDAILSGLGVRDTRSAAKKMADFADDLAQTAPLSKPSRERARVSLKMDADVAVLTSGQESMFKLGQLGRDLGEIVEADLMRIAKGRKQLDFLGTELAARDLAARLRQPDPSFGASGGRGPSESGGGSGSPSQSGESGEGGAGDDVAKAFEEAVRDIEKLASDHAEHIAETEQAMQGTPSAEELKALSEELKKHAEMVRKAASELPGPSESASGSESLKKAASAREQAEQMAKAFENAEPKEGAQAGNRALSELNEAKRSDQSAQDAKKQADASRKLAQEVEWAEKTFEQLRKKARDRGSLGKQGEREAELGERARELAGNGKEVLPQESERALQDAAEKAREAARALKQGEGDRALSLQREAQRSLERAKRALGKSEKGKPEDVGDDAEGRTQGRADIPKADAHRSPEEWRKRVLQGLAEPSGNQYKEAVKRYAEGLVK